MHSPRYHLIFDITHARDINDPERLKTFVSEVISAIHMTILEGPIVCEGVPENPGLTCFAVLDFSHVSLYGFSKFDEILIDIFSCKEFDRATARAFCEKFFTTPTSVVREKEVWWGEV